MLWEIKAKYIQKPILFFMLSVFLMLDGCALGPFMKFEYDVSDKEDLWLKCGVKKDGIYQLIDDVFIEYNNGIKKYCLGPTLEYVRKSNRCVLKYHTSSCLLSDYKSGNDSCHVDILGVVDKGTKIMFNRIERSLEIYHFFVPYVDNHFFAIILEGPFKGAVVDVMDLTIGETVSIRSPNPDLLRLVVPLHNSSNSDFTQKQSD